MDSETETTNQSLRSRLTMEFLPFLLLLGIILIMLISPKLVSILLNQKWWVQTIFWVITLPILGYAISQQILTKEEREMDKRVEKFKIQINQLYPPKPEGRISAEFIIFSIYFATFPIYLILIITNLFSQYLELMAIYSVSLYFMIILSIYRNTKNQRYNKIGFCRVCGRYVEVPSETDDIDNDNLIEEVDRKGCYDVCNDIYHRNSYLGMVLIFGILTSIIAKPFVFYIPEARFVVLILYLLGNLSFFGLAIMAIYYDTPDRRNQLDGYNHASVVVKLNLNAKTDLHKEQISEIYASDYYTVKLTITELSFDERLDQILIIILSPVLFWLGYYVHSSFQV